MTDPRRVCCVKRCRRVVRRAFDVYDPWHARYVGGKLAPDTPKRRYEVCDKHAAELFDGREGYLKRSKFDAITKRAVAR